MSRTVSSGLRQYRYGRGPAVPVSELGRPTRQRDPLAEPGLARNVHCARRGSAARLSCAAPGRQKKRLAGTAAAQKMKTGTNRVERDGLMKTTISVMMMAMVLAVSVRAETPEKGCAGKCAVAAGACGTGAGACAMKAAEKIGGEEAAVPTIGTATLATLLDAGIDMVLLDARGGKYDDGRRIPGAKNLPGKPEATAVAKLIPSKKALVVTYCSHTKCPASSRLAAHLRGLGYANVVEYPVGIKGWAEAGKRVEKPL